MSEKIPDEVQGRIDRMAEAFREQLAALYVWSNEEPTGDEAMASQIEKRIREWIKRIGEDTQALLLEGMDRNRRKGKTVCPRCGSEEYWKGYESRQYITSLGRCKSSGPTTIMEHVMVDGCPWMSDLDLERAN